MHVCLLLIPLLALLGFWLHRTRLRAQERQLDARVAERVRALVEERADAQEKADELVALDSAKSRIVATLIDELRTPLMLITAPLQNRTGVGGRLEAEGLNVSGLLEQTARLKRRIEQIGELLSVEVGPSRLDAAGVDVVGVLDRCVHALRPAAERHGVSLDFESTTPHLVGRFDRAKLEQVVESLFRRIFEDTTEGDRIRLALTRKTGPDGVVAVLECFDTGRHISETYRRLLAEPHHWAQLGEVVDHETGLRLALAARAVRLHGGKIEVDGDASFGTRIRLTLPVPPAKEDAQPAATPFVSGDAVSGLDLASISLLATGDYEKPMLPVEERHDDKDTTVLVVDDHPGTRGYLSFALRKQHRVLEAANGEEALALVREHTPDLVVSDIMMPVMDGQALCRAIKTDNNLNHIPVFLVTANTVADLKREGLESGADDYLIKPFDLDEAIMRINNMIALRRELRRRYSREVVIKPSDITVSSADEAFLERARELIEANIEDGNFGVQELASQLGLSPRQLQRRLRETVDQSPVEFIRSLRLQRAAQLLEQQYGNVSEVAYSVGFTSLSYFAKCFREQFGMSPSEFKSEQAA